MLKDLYGRTNVVSSASAVIWSIKDIRSHIQRVLDNFNDHINTSSYINPKHSYCRPILCKKYNVVIFQVYLEYGNLSEKERDIQKALGTLDFDRSYINRNFEGPLTDKDVKELKSLIWKEL